MIRNSIKKKNKQIEDLVSNKVMGSKYLDNFKNSL
jgi:hypothetical protein